MIWLSELWRRVKHLGRRKQFEEDLAEEMRLHLELRAADRARDGLPPQDAAAEAKRRFGNVTQLRETSREAWSWRFWDILAQDIRYGLRTLVSHPGFTLTALLSLTLGIGANTALFSIVNAVMLRSLPVEDAHRLVRLESGDNPYFTNPIWESVRDHQQAFSGAFAYSNARFDLAEGGEIHYANGLWVSGDYFRTLGVPAIRGRVITADDDRHGCGPSGPVAVISHSFWKSHFASDPAVVGRTVKLDRRPFEIVGVTPAWFTGLDVDQIYDVAIPIGCEPLINTDRSALDQRSWWWLRIMGRLKPGISIEEAGARVKAMAPEVRRATLPANWDAKGQKEYLEQTFGVSPAPTGHSQIRARYRPALLTLMAGVGLVLLIACANVATLMLARSLVRQREISVRLAIGASRVRVMRQILTESLLLSFIGAAGGMLLAVWGGGLLVKLLSTAGDQIQLDAKPDWTVLAFTAAVAAGTGLLFGILPALRSTSHKLNDVLKEGARGSVAGSTRFHLGKALVVAQIALSLILLIGAGLFAQTFRKLVTLDTGFDKHSLLVVNASVQPAQVPKERRIQLFESILERLQTIPSVTAASLSDMTPLSNWVWNQPIYPEGVATQEREPGDGLVYFNRVTPGYFRTMRIGLLAGRDFDPRDNLAGPRVIVISQATARHFWKGDNPVGRIVRMDRDMEPGKQDPYQVIGVVNDVKYGQLTEKTRFTAYVPVAQNADPWPRMSFELRTTGKPEDTAREVRSRIAGMDRSVSLEFRTMESQISDSLVQERLLAVLSAFFGLLALCLAVTGLYGVVAYVTARRRNEIGIRVALGARYASVLRLVLSDVAVMLVAGVAIGVAGALAGGRLVTSLVYDVAPTDPVVIASAVALLGAATTAAGYLPARRAARMDPMIALREE